MQATALIAEDEPLLAANLQAELATRWPGLRILATVGSGTAAVSQALSLRPEVLFLDIRMPGMTGLEAASALAEDWPDEGAPFPLLVFVTAYDQYALQAFDHAAVDYVLKPVQPDRLTETCQRLQAALAQRRTSPAAAPPGAAAALPGGPGLPNFPEGLQAAIAQLQQVAAQVGSGFGQTATEGGRPPNAAARGPLLRVIQASAGHVLHLVPIEQVVYFEAADKYVRVITAEREHLIRSSLRELQPQLDDSVFWQVHRSVIVRADAIRTAVRDESGRLTLSLASRPETLQVSRLYAHLFKAM